ncbi:MAG: response regulator transcription factor [Nocardioidaceae bacterium]
MTSVLVVEDDPGIRDALVRGLVERGHAVTGTAAGLGALELVAKAPPDVLLLDLGLPDVDGLQVLAMLRGLRDVPVIVITAKDDDALLVQTLDAGADDYVVKPFGLEQIAARIRAVLRRTGAAGGDTPIVVGDLVVDARTRTVTLRGEPVALARKEFDLLLALAVRSGEVVSKRALLAEVWQQAYGGPERTVDVHLSWLRRKLGETAEHPQYLHTVRGVGVRLVEPGAAKGEPATGAG